MAEFLSDAWLDALDVALRSAPPVDVPGPVVIEQLVHGVPGRGDVRYRVRIDDAGARVDGADGDAAIRLTTDYATAVAVAQGSESAQAALAAGRLRLGGDVDVLVGAADGLRALADAAARVRSATTYPGS